MAKAICEQKWLNLLLFVATVYIECQLVKCNTYTTTDLVLWNYQTVPEPSSENGLTNWEACEAAFLKYGQGFQCRSHATCQVFEFFTEAGQTVCIKHENALGFGSLVDDDRITGQLDSPSPTAVLSWLGIGAFASTGIGPLVLGVGSMTHARCQAECDGILALFGVECVSYRISWMGTFLYFCWPMTNAYVDTTRSDSETKAGVKDDLVLNKTGVVGDLLQSRVIPAEFPPAPADPFSPAVYTEFDFNYKYGLDGFKSIERMQVANWNLCSDECHQRAYCFSFLFYVDAFDGNKAKCDLFNAAILGKTQPGYGKYGVIDKGVGSGEHSVVDAKYSMQGEDVFVHGQKLFTAVLVETFDDCVKACYDFYRPKLCIAFFYTKTTKTCTLLDALPCATNVSTSLSRTDLDWWDAVEYRFGVIDDRVDPTTWGYMDECGLEGSKPTTTVTQPTTTTATTTTATTPTTVALTTDEITAPIPVITIAPVVPTTAAPAVIVMTTTEQTNEALTTEPTTSNEVVTTVAPAATTVAPVATTIAPAATTVVETATNTGNETANITEQQTTETLTMEITTVAEPATTVPPAPAVTTVAPPPVGATTVAPPPVGATTVAPPPVGATTVAPPPVAATTVAPPPVGATTVAPPPVGATTVAPPPVAATTVAPPAPAATTVAGATVATTQNNICHNVNTPQCRRSHGDTQMFYHYSDTIVAGLDAPKTTQERSNLNCALECHRTAWCRSFDWDVASGACRLFEGSDVDYGISTKVVNNLD